MDKISEIFKSLGEKNRLRIVLLLSERPMCVCEINEVLHIALSTISAHLKNLKYAGLIKDEKEGRWVIYRLSDDHFVQDLIKKIKDTLKNDPIFLKDKEKALKVSREDLSSCS
ncbi:ArsR/SmtB family transcription factor [Deferribacter autotrophicus]|nr:metalloregulator ArsR/SmtB family transcription factor [Deferribacter autotrophicus]